MTSHDVTQAEPPGTHAPTSAPLVYFITIVYERRIHRRRGGCHATASMGECQRNDSTWRAT